MPHAEETRQPAAFRLEGVDREGVEVAPARVRHMVLAATQAAVIPGVDDVEHQRPVGAYGRMQAGGRLPGAVAHPGDEFAHGAGGYQRHALAVAGDAVALRRGTAELYLHALDRGIHV